MFIHSSWGTCERRIAAHFPVRNLCLRCLIFTLKIVCHSNRIPTRELWHFCCYGYVCCACTSNTPTNNLFLFVLLLSPLESRSQDFMLLIVTNSQATKGNTSNSSHWSSTNLRSLQFNSLNFASPSHDVPRVSEEIAIVLTAIVSIQVVSIRFVVFCGYKPRSQIRSSVES